PPQPATLFPYTTLFRSVELGQRLVGRLHRDQPTDGHAIAIGPVHVGEERVVPADEPLSHLVVLDPAGSERERGILNYVVHPQLRSEEHTSELQSLRHLV